MKGADSDREFIDLDEFYRMMLSSVDKAAAHRFCETLFRRIFPAVKKTKLDHATILWAVGELVAALIESSEPESPDLAMAGAIAVSRTSLSILRERMVGGERQVGHA